MIQEVGKATPNKDCVELFEHLLEEAKEGRIRAASVACIADENCYYTRYVGENRLELLAPISTLAHRINEELLG